MIPIRIPGIKVGWNSSFLGRNAMNGFATIECWYATSRDTPTQNAMVHSMKLKDILISKVFS